MNRLRSPWIRLGLFACLVLAAILALQVNWDRSYRSASGVPRSFAPFGDEIRRPDGSVDYRGTLNQLLGEPPQPEQNALAIYLPFACQRDVGSSSLRPTLLRTLGVSEAAFAAGRNFSADWESSGAGNTGIDAIWMSDAEYPLIAAWLDRYQPELSRIRGATKLRWYCPLLNENPDELLVYDLLPHIQGMRTLSRMLLASCHREAGRGNPAGAIEDILAIHRLGLQTQGSLVIQNLVSVSIRTQARQATIRILQKFQLNETELDSLTALADPEGMSELFGSSVTRSERYLALDLLQQIDRKQANLSQLPDLGETAAAFAWIARAWAFVDGGQILQSVNNRFDAFDKSLKLVPPQGSALYQALNEIRHSSPQGLLQGSNWGQRVGMLFSPNLRGRVLGKSLSLGDWTNHLEATCSKVLVRNTQQMRLLQLALALERYRCRIGGYPESLAQLLPEYLPQLPPDLFAEQGTFAYEKLEAGFGLSANSTPPAALELGDALEYRLLINRSAEPAPTEDKLR